MCSLRHTQTHEAVICTHVCFPSIITLTKASMFVGCLQMLWGEALVREPVARRAWWLDVRSGLGVMKKMSGWTSAARQWHRESDRRGIKLQHEAVGGLVGVDSQVRCYLTGLTHSWGLTMHGRLSHAPLLPYLLKLLTYGCIIEIIFHQLVYRELTRALWCKRDRHTDGWCVCVQWDGQTRLLTLLHVWPWALGVETLSILNVGGYVIWSLIQMCIFGRQLLVSRGIQCYLSPLFCH